MSGVIVVDNFLADPCARRDQALLAKYETVGATGASFPNISIVSLADAANDTHLMPQAKNLRLEGSFFRLTLPEDRLPTFIHNDLAMAQKTGILYLNRKEARGGTAFWRHRESGLTRAPTPADLERFGGIDYMIKLQEDGLIEKRWEMTSLTPMLWNRFLFFDSGLWHSPWPRHGWGTELKNGRLIQVFFLT